MNEADLHRLRLVIAGYPDAIRETSDVPAALTLLAAAKAVILTILRVRHPGIDAIGTPPLGALAAVAAPDTDLADRIGGLVTRMEEHAHYAEYDERLLDLRRAGEDFVAIRSALLELHAQLGAGRDP